jgi:hypothetical protein
LRFLPGLASASARAFRRLALRMRWSLSQQFLVLAKQLMIRNLRLFCRANSSLRGCVLLALAVAYLFVFGSKSSLHSHSQALSSKCNFLWTVIRFPFPVPISLA